MGRSVSMPSETQCVCFGYLEETEDFEYLVDKIRSVMTQKFPSLVSEDKWIGREDHVLLQNNHAYIGVSEYCGVVALWLAPRNSGDHEVLQNGWLSIVEKNFRKQAERLLPNPMRKVGIMSNGESVYK